MPVRTSFPFLLFAVWLVAVAAASAAEQAAPSGKPNILFIAVDDLNDWVGSWAEATRLPLLIRVPGQQERADCTRVVNLIDLYPTLIELAGLPAKPAGALDGRSFAPLVREPSRTWPHPTLVVSPAGKGAAVIDERWYFIRHGNGTDEFYDMQGDPLQWQNLARERSPEVARERARLERHFPAEFAPALAPDPRGRKTGAPDPTIKATRRLAELQ